MLTLFQILADTDLVTEATSLASEVAEVAGPAAEESSGFGSMQGAQLWMVAGFLILGWVLARRQMKMGKRVNREARAASRELKKIQTRKDPVLPLSDAPPETQRWQVAMFDLQRELTAELDTRISIVQTLMNQADKRIERLEELEAVHRE
ncbi:hypothetical protein LF1_42330 [Rubripirellula obstinata]|uniref:Uncharacterized protein n=1 Tax=Rubripirellula obstinata TaxID=406547 RepID=A0A5B1CKT6_9BACT|nr:hypothetical protein [Rubripirellula obstinata]KAA1261678.1 hypothetical protein LF1_42330 [Rubripirellula obstinata]